MNKENIVIVGGGFAGISAALKLTKRSVTDKYNVILINKTERMLFTPDLYELLGNPHKEKKVTVDIKNIFLFRKIHLIFDSAESIDTDKKQVLLKNNSPINYKYLLITTGSSMNSHGITSIEKYAYILKDADDAEKIHEKLVNLCNDCLINTRPYNIVIGGAGYTGVEIGAEIADFTKSLFHDKKINHENLNIFMINPSDKLLKNMENGAGDAARQKLKDLGVKIVENEKVVHITENKIEMADGSSMDYDMFIWSGGVKGNEIISKSKFSPKDYSPSSRLITDKYMQVKDNENIFACGDSATMEDQDIPMLAQVAIEEGKLAGKNIAAKIHDKPMKEFKLHLHGQIIPISGDYSYGVLFGHVVKGRIAIFLQKLIFLNFLLQILPPIRAFIKWGIYLVK